MCTANMAQPLYSALSEQGVHASVARTSQKLCVSNYILPGYAQDGTEASQMELSYLYCRLSMSAVR